MMDTAAIVASGSGELQLGASVGAIEGEVEQLDTALGDMNSVLLTEAEAKEITELVLSLKKACHKASRADDLASGMQPVASAGGIEGEVEQLNTAPGDVNTALTKAGGEGIRGFLKKASHMVSVADDLVNELQSGAFGGDIECKFRQLSSALGVVKWVLAETEGKEIENIELVRSLKEASYLASHANDLMGELEYYRIREDLEREEHKDDHDKAAEPIVQNCAYSTEHSSSAALQIVPYVASSMVPAASNTSLEPRRGILCEINEHIQSCCKMAKTLLEAIVPAKLDDLARIVQKNQNIGTDPRETSPFPTEPKVYGRDKDRDWIISKLTSNESAEQDLSVLCIMGHGGVGKTTLAKVVFNDSAVSKHFPVRLWAYVSTHFDQAKIMHKLLECLIGNKHEGIKSLKDLQDILQYEVKSKRVLVVLDDIWEDIQKEKWDDLLTPLLSNGVQGNKILVTTRKPSVVKFTVAKDQLNLEGLDPIDFWHLFKECVFGDENYKVPSKLQKTGEEIIDKLKGNPLAAKSIGKVLSRDHDNDFWITILDNSEWKHKTDDYDIMPALMISYNYLPVHLKRCFSYCSVFPKYHRYKKERLVNIWIAQNFVSSTDTHKRLEDVGDHFFNDLVEWGFFQKASEFGGLLIMHDLIHDLAQKVSSHDSFTIENSERKEAPWLVRHVSIITDREYMSQVDGTVLINESFLQEFSGSFAKLQRSNLSTIMLFGPLDLAFGKTVRQEFSEVKSVRVLKLEMAVFDLDLVIENISGFVNLRYLELGCFYQGSRLKLPEAICRLYHLQVLDIMKNWEDRTVLPRGMNKLVNLRHFIAKEKLVAKIASIGTMVSLQEITAFGVRKVSEFSITQLGRLNQLRGSIHIHNLNDVASQEEAAEARICDKVHLTTLRLSWGGVDGQNAGFSSKIPILEDLQPHPGLINLIIEAYECPSPSWLSNNIHLTSLRSLHLDNCSRWLTIPEPHQLPLLRELHLAKMAVSTVVIGCLEILILCYLPSLRHCTVLDKEQLSRSLRVLEVQDCEKLEEFPLPVLQDFQFTSLHRLRVHQDNCFSHSNIPQLLRMDSLVHVDLWLQPSRQEFKLQPDPSNGLQLEIKGGLSRTVSRIEESLFGFHKLKNLAELEITRYPHLTYLPWEGLQNLTSLKMFKLIWCNKLFSNNVELILPPSVEELEFDSCNITEKHLSQLLLNLPTLKNLVLSKCREVTSLPVGLFTDEKNQKMSEGSWHIASSCLRTLERLQISLPKDSAASLSMHFSSRKGFGRFVALREVVIENCPAPLPTMLQGRVVPTSSLVKLIVTAIEDSYVQFSKFSSLVELQVWKCLSLTSVNLDSCTALQVLKIEGCVLLSSIEGLQSCKVLRDLRIHGCELLPSLRAPLSNLTKVSIENNPKLARVDLNSCKALQKLCIKGCATMVSFEGLISLVNLEELKVENSPGFTRSWLSAAAAAEVDSEHNYSMGTLQVLDIDEIGFLCMPICSHLPSLKKLIIHGAHMVGVWTDDHEKALVRLTSLRQFEFRKFKHLRSLPAYFHSLVSLERFILDSCGCITSLPVGGLPASLKEMELHNCSEELNALCIEICQV